MYWRLPPRSGLFLRRSYLFSSIFGVGYTKFYNWSVGSNQYINKFERGNCTISLIIIDRLGKENTIADFLSRMQNNNDDVHVKDNFPNEYYYYLFIVV